jgi:hypothetical protein
MRLQPNAFVPIAVMLIAVIMSAATMAAQNSPESAPVPIALAGQVALSPKAPMIAMHVDNMDAAPAKGAPFCATVATEHTQTFADGNRIHTADNSTLCRDGEGRTRREAGLNLLGAGPRTTASRLITIDDAVSGVRYMLDPDNEIAHKMILPSPDHLAKTISPAGLPEKSEHVMVYRSADSAAGPVLSSNVFFKKGGQDSDEATSSENLGDQNINGILATGTRMTTTIPAGKMGNDKPIAVTSERWYSSDLKATVMTKHTDPWAGELKTEFTNVNTSEPDPFLFKVPSDYKILDDKAGPFTMQISAPVPPAH